MMTKQVTSQKSAFDLIKTSLYDEMEGSGQDDFDLASIQPTKVTEMVKETRLPELVRKHLLYCKLAEKEKKQKCKNC